MTAQQDSPGPTQAARESHPTVCSRPIETQKGALCILRTRHDGPCERLRTASCVYDVVACLEPASGAHDRCSLCYRNIDYGQWKLIVPETMIQSAPLTICRTCGGELGQHLLTFPAGPAPDPSPTDDPDDWHPGATQARES